MNDDYSIVKVVICGNQCVYEMLMNCYCMLIYYMMLKMVNNCEDVDDLMIEVFGKVFFKFFSYVFCYVFSIWLFCIVINNGIDYICCKCL